MNSSATPFFARFLMCGSLAVGSLLATSASTLAQLEAPTVVIPANPQAAPETAPEALPNNPTPDAEIEGLENSGLENSGLEDPTEQPSADLPGIDTANYTDEKISVNYPSAWQLEMLEDGVMISNVATEPADLIATQIVRMAAPPGAVVNANIESFEEEGSAVARYSRATIDGHDALVMWLAERPDELGNAIATFIGYEDETILMFSRYSAENAAAEEAILRLHTSFADPTDAAASGESALDGDSVVSEEDISEEDISEEDTGMEAIVEDSELPK